MGAIILHFLYLVIPAPPWLIPYAQSKSDLGGLRAFED